MIHKPQKEILSYMKRGGKLTVHKAAYLFSTTELRRIISRLRKRGYQILDRRFNAVTNDGRKTHFKEYYMINQ